MKVAIVGANFLGSATAYYLRKVLDANRAESSTKNGNHEKDEIVVFEQRSYAGGQKFNVLSLNGFSAPTGTASSLDVSAAPLFKSLLDETSFPLPPTARSREWSIFDWDADSYCISKYRSSILSSISSSFTAVVLLQFIALTSTVFFFPRFRKKGIHFFMDYRFDEDNFNVSDINVVNIFWFLFTLFFAGGFIPVRWLFRFYNLIIHHFAIKFTSSVLFGIPIISSVHTIVQHFREQLELIHKHDSCSSCITLGHLLSACGLAKYVKKSTTEYFGSLQIPQNFFDQCVTGPMSLSYAHSSVKATSNSNSLATLLSLLTTAPVPVSLRSKPRYFSSDDTEQLCPAIIKSADAQLRLNTHVVSVMKNGENQFDVSGVVDDSEVNLGTFDAVFIAAVPDPNQFKSDALDGECEHIFSLTPMDQIDTSGESGLNLTKYVSLVKGELKASYFKMGSPSKMPDQVYVLKSVNCSEIVRLSDDVWKVTSAEKFDRNSTICETTFNKVDDFVSIKRTSRAYSVASIRNVQGNSAPNIILGRRFINVAAIDRVCNDVNMECIAARNAASLLRDGLVTWK